MRRALMYERDDRVRDSILQSAAGLREMGIDVDPTRKPSDDDGTREWDELPDEDAATLINNTKVALIAPLSGRRSRGMSSTRHHRGASGRSS